MPQTHQPHHQLVFLLVIVFVMLASFGASSFISSQSESAQENQAENRSPIPLPHLDEKSRAEITNNASYSVGPDDAKVTVVEFFDYQCSFSKAAATTIDELIKEYRGKSVRFVFRNFPLLSTHTLALPGAEAALCAGDQGRYKEMHDALYSVQDSLDENQISSVAARLRLDLSSFNSCRGEKKYQKRVMQDIAAASAVGVTVTPTFFINERTILGAQPIDFFRAAIDEQLNK